MKIGIGGCSHSSKSYGNAWWYYMGKKLNAEIIPSSSDGMGNEINVEKIKGIIDKHPDVDLIIYQVTDPARLTVGIKPYEGNHQFKDMELLSHPYYYNKCHYYSFRNRFDINEFNKCFNTNFSREVESLFTQIIVPSNFNTDYKVFHTLLTMQKICEINNKKIVFFSWFVDLKELALKTGYDYIIKDMNILDGFVSDEVIKRGINTIPNNTHFDSKNQCRIFEEILYPKLLSFI